MLHLNRARDVKTRITRVIAIVIIGVLLMLAACGTPAPATPTPAPLPTPPTLTLPPPPPTPSTPAPPPPPPPPPPLPPPPPPPPPTPLTTVQGPYDVWIPGREFSPSILTVPVGTKVTWVSKDGEQHTVTSATNLFLGDLPPFGSFSFTFTERGSYEYHCDPHPEMVGKVVVE